MSERAGDECTSSIMDYLAVVDISYVLYPIIYQSPTDHYYTLSQNGEMVHYMAQAFLSWISPRSDGQQLQITPLP